MVILSSEIGWMTTAGSQHSGRVAEKLSVEHSGPLEPSSHTGPLEVASEGRSEPEGVQCGKTWIITSGNLCPTGHAGNHTSPSE